MINLESAQLFFLGRVLVHSPASPSLYFYRTSAYVENLVHHHLPSNFLIVLGMPPVRTLKGELSTVASVTTKKLELLEKGTSVCRNVGV